MITREKVDEYIDKIPPANEALRLTLHALAVGDLTKAAKIAKTDLALNGYLKGIVNKPIYGFRNEVNDVAQIFGILGVEASHQAVYNYMIQLLSPAKWHLFKLNRHSFADLQDKLTLGWVKILKHLNIKDQDLYNAITLLPASILVAEALFNERVDDVKLLRSVKNLDYNTILERLCGMNLFAICEAIALKWEMPVQIAHIVHLSSGLSELEASEQELLLGRWMHLLLFYELSQPLFIEAGLNDFIDFHPEFIADVYEEFTSLMEIA
ncbi:MAG: HDOD domain-containing protein [Epsilonproteobacteria bacterium]|nr:HDOD domain-containing protein [Campylobacterota bacterium]